MVLQLVALVKQLAMDNNKTKEQFILTLEYGGIPTSLVNLTKSDKLESFCQMLSKYFEEWLEHCQEDKTSEVDIGSLRKGDFDSMDPSAKEKLRLFLCVDKG